MGLTINEAKRLQRGDTLYHVVHRNADGTPQRWRVNGAPQIWKRSPERVRVPVKHGLYAYDALSEDTLSAVEKDELTAFCGGRVAYDKLCDAIGVAWNAIITPELRATLTDSAGCANVDDVMELVLARMHATDNVVRIKRYAATLDEMREMKWYYYATLVSRAILRADAELRIVEVT